MTRIEIAKVIESFLNETGDEWAWDDFIHSKMDTVEMEEIRGVCSGLPENFPPVEAGHYCNEEGIKVLEQIAHKLSQ